MKVENISIVGLQPSIRGMRNPKDSWQLSDTRIFHHLNPLDPKFQQMMKDYDPKLLINENGTNGYFTFVYEYLKKSDDPYSGKIRNFIDYNPYISKYMIRTLRDDYFNGTEGSKHDPCDSDFTNFVEIETDKVILIGPNDFGLMKKLATGGPVHRKYARMINVYMDLTASFDFWKEYDTYKVGTVANSCSTMHRITRNPMTIDNFSKADLREKDIDFMRRCVNYYNDDVLHDDSLSEIEKTRIMSKLNLTGFEQKRTLELNYEVIANICNYRRGHKLAEWRYLTNYIFMQFPYFKDLFYTKYDTDSEEFDEFPQPFDEKISSEEENNK